jgi:hypothetical protein
MGPPRLHGDSALSVVSDPVSAGNADQRAVVAGHEHAILKRHRAAIWMRRESIGSLDRSAHTLM